MNSFEKWLYEVGMNKFNDEDRYLLANIYIMHDKLMCGAIHYSKQMESWLQRVRAITEDHYNETRNR